MSYKYRSFIKKLTYKSALKLKGIIPEDMPFDLKGKEDLEGYPGLVGIGYILKEETFHPTSPGVQVVHPYDEILIFGGTNWDDLLWLGAEINIWVGSEKVTITESSVAILPRGIPHGPIEVKKLSSPVIHIMLGNGNNYQDAAVLRSKAQGQHNYADLVKRLTTSKSAYEGYVAVSPGPVKINERGVMDLTETGPGEAYQIVQMHPEDLHGIEISFSWEFCRTTGVWMSTRYAHVHPEPELLVALSLKGDDIHNLGASLEFWFGTEREVYVIDRPSIITIPRAWIPHTPLITQKVDRPFGFMLTCPGTYSRAAYVETGCDVL